VLIYQLDTRDERKHQIAENLIKQALATQGACISFQVVQEWLNTVLRKAEVRLDVVDARAWLDTVLVPLVCVAPTPALYRRGLDVQKRWK
jgi:predicted nucleic acid-binding protein